MKKMQHLKRSSWVNMGGFFGLGMLAGIILLIAITRLTWHTKFYPGIKIAGVEVSGLDREQAKVKLVGEINNYKAKLLFNDTEWEIPTESIAMEVEPTLNEAYRYGRRLRVDDYLLLLINKKTNFPIKLSEGKTNKFDIFINELASVIEIPPVDPVIKIVGSKIEITNGTDGVVIDSASLDKKIANNYSQMSNELIVISTIVINKQLAPDELIKLKNSAEILISKNLILKLDDENIKIGGKELISFLSTTRENEDIKINTITEYVNGLSASLDKEPQDAKFEFSENKVKEFSPGKDGVEINVQLTTNDIERGIKKLLDTEIKSETVEITASRTPPKITTDKVNELGIRERIGRGESYYAHSIPNRIYNVALASSRINSALMAPGEEVSFNKLVGEVSAATGYRPAYIISAGRTVLGDGGGLCQVSTTMFRAAMNAGLPILERWGHAYRVSYYELNSKPGVDATVIAPSKDFRFKNDTPGHILIQTINDPKNLHLVIEIYGTSDGRVASISEPKVWGVTPPLPTIYQDDPTLPTGTTKQVDWAAAGAKASFDYKVTRNGETIQDKTFSTTYRSWASVFLRGTGI